MTEYFESEYIYNGLRYNVGELMEVHIRLQNDDVFFNKYMESNICRLDVSSCNSVPPTEHLSCELLPSNSINNSSSVEESGEQHVWTVNSTKLLLELYKSRKEKFRDPKSKKRNLWAEIVKEMTVKGYRGLTEDRLDRKLRNLKKTYRTIKDNNKKTSTGRGRISWEYYDTFEDIFSNDATINFGHTLSSFKSANTSSCALPIISSPTCLTTSPANASSCALAMSSPTCLTTSPANASSCALAISSPTLQMTSPAKSSNASRCALPLISPDLLDKKQSFPSLKAAQKSSNSKESYNLRKRLIEVEKERIAAIEKMTKSIDESNKIQRERNELLKRFLDKN